MFTSWLNFTVMFHPPQMLIGRMPAFVTSILAQNLSGPGSLVSVDVMVKPSGHDDTDDATNSGP